MKSAAAAPAPYRTLRELKLFLLKNKDIRIFFVIFVSKLSIS